MEESWSYLTSANAVSIPTDPWLRPYSRLKLGFVDALEHYAVALADELIGTVLKDQPPRAWLVTGPPVAAVPSAANHLARLVAHRTAAGVPTVGAIRSRNLRKRTSRGSFPGGHYAELSDAQRARYQEDASTRWVRDKSFAGSAVAVINDADVTGAQERALSRFLCDLGAVRVHWQYIVKVQLPPGTDSAHIEPLLNDATIPSADVLRDVLEGARLWPTTKLLWRLFESDLDTFRAVIDAFPATFRASLVELIDAEEFSLDKAAQERRELLTGRGLFGRES